MRYGIVGSGRQGTAAAYDLMVAGGAGRLLLVDRDPLVAQAAADRLASLPRSDIRWAAVDIADGEALTHLLEPLDVFVCAAPYPLIPRCTDAALAARTSMVDLGGHTPTVLEQLRRGPEAERAGITIVPDCGMGPGLNNTLALATVELLERRGARPREVRVWDGGLPQEPRSPWGYDLFFNIDGLTNEYDGRALVLRQGRVQEIDTLTELETIEFEGVGPLEAFVTSGGTSTVPYTMEGILEVYENKTLRYPGHFDRFRAFKDLGLFSTTPIEVDGGHVVPRSVYHALLEPQIWIDVGRDVAVMRAEGVGETGAGDVTVRLDLIDRYDPETGFTAMERLTGWHAAIMAWFIGADEVPHGVVSLERAVGALRFLDEVRRRGISITESWR